MKAAAASGPLGRTMARRSPRPMPWPLSAAMVSPICWLSSPWESGRRPGAAIATSDGRLEGIPHAHGLLEERHVLLAQLLEAAEGKHAPEALLQVFAHLLLVEGEGIHALFQIAGQQELQVVAIDTDELAQEVHGQKI